MDSITMSLLFGAAQGIKGIRGKGPIFDAIFGKSAAEEFDKRKNALFGQIDQRAKRQLGEVGKIYGGMEAQATQNIGRRAAALGRTGSVESSIAPAVSRIQGLHQRSIESIYDTAEQSKLRLDAEGLNQPMEPNLFESALEGYSVGKASERSDELVKAIQGFYNQGPSGPPPVGVDTIPDVVQERLSDADLENPLDVFMSPVGGFFK